MFWVEYFCPRQSPFWQRGQQPYSTLYAAMVMAQALKPPQGQARVLDCYGQIVYSL